MKAQPSAYLLARGAAPAHQSRMRQDPDELIPTRASLLLRLKDWRDNSSWQEFFDTYWKLIYGVARKAGLGDDEAQDVVQETLVSAAKHMPTFKYDPSIGSFKAWLLTMTRWRIIAQFRKRGPTVDAVRESDSAATALVEKTADPAGQALDAMWEAEWENNLLEAAIAKVRRRIDPDKYQIFDFYVNKDWPPAKVADRFHVSVDQVYLVKHRVTDAIRSEVKRLQEEVT
jgi:RNA polymerase sigma-70 factor (ECF subfamily)